MAAVSYRELTDLLHGCGPAPDLAPPVDIDEVRRVAKHLCDDVDGLAMSGSIPSTTSSLAWYLAHMLGLHDFADGNRWGVEP